MGILLLQKAPGIPAGGKRQIDRETDRDRERKTQREKEKEREEERVKEKHTHTQKKLPTYQSSSSGIWLSGGDKHQR